MRAFSEGPPHGAQRHSSVGRSVALATDPGNVTGAQLPSIEHPARRPLDRRHGKPALLLDALNGKHIGNGFILGT